MPPPETYKNESRNQPEMCQVHTAAYVSLLAPGKLKDYTAYHPKNITTYMLHVQSIVIYYSIYHYACSRKTRSLME